MNILVIGSGAREHAIMTALKRSPQRPTLFCCGSSINPGMKPLTQGYWTGDVTDVKSVLAQARQWEIDLAVIGPEAPLEKGIADALWAANIKTVGPKKSLARIETSKSFARDLMRAYHIPGLPDYDVFTTTESAETFLKALGSNGYVIKADGLMSGKGVKVSGEHLMSHAEALAYCDEILALGNSLVIEEKLIGQEFSLMCFCDGEQLIPMPVVQDHKRAYVGDIGPNTGGMGSYSDSNHRLPFLTEEEVASAFDINDAVIRALTKETNQPYQGILYGSFITTKKGVYVIEFNARFGDPEALNVLSILDSDLVAIFNAITTGTLTRQHCHFLNLATVCKYAVPNGYPIDPIKNALIDVSDLSTSSNLYFGAVEVLADKLIATGSRTAACVGVAATLTQAETMAEQDIKKIKGPLFHREDIGTDHHIKNRIAEMQRLRQV